MCGRFATYKNLKNLKNIFDLKLNNKKISTSYNISPGQKANILLNYDHQNYLLPTFWGYNYFSNNNHKMQTIINSRVETIDQKLLFRDSFLKRKCVIPANGYYEWGVIKNQKKPFYFQLGEGELIYFAGIWRKENFGNENKRVFSIITKQSNAKINKIHHRMPLILNANDAFDYIENKNNNFLFNQYDDLDLDFFEVSAYVNNPKNNDKKCINPVN